MASIETGHAQDRGQHQKAYPSEVVRTDSVPQQASTQPGDGYEVHASHGIHNHEGETNTPNVVELPAQKVPFKDQVIGYAQKARGTLLAKPHVREHGTKVLEGQAPAIRPGKEA